MKLFLEYLNKVKGCIIWSFFCVGIFLLLFLLTDIRLEAILYPALLCGVFGILFLFIGFLRFSAKQQWLERLLGDQGPYSMSLPDSSDEVERLYQELLSIRDNISLSANGDYVEKTSSLEAEVPLSNIGFRYDRLWRV